MDNTWGSDPVLRSLSDAAGSAELRAAARLVAALLDTFAVPSCLKPPCRRLSLSLKHKRCSSAPDDKVRRYVVYVKYCTLDLRPLIPSEFDHQSAAQQTTCLESPASQLPTPLATSRV